MHIEKRRFIARNFSALMYRVPICRYNQQFIFSHAYSVLSVTFESTFYFYLLK